MIMVTLKYQNLFDFTKDVEMSKYKTRTLELDNKKHWKK